MTVRLSAMFEEHMKIILYNWKSSLRRERLSKIKKTKVKRKIKSSSVSGPNRGTKPVKILNGAGKGLIMYICKLFFRFLSG